MPFCRVAPSLGALEDTPENIWGTEVYSFWKHRNEPTVFFGLYDLRDYIALWLHSGKKWVLWAGSDIRNLQSGFIFNDGKLKTLSQFFGGIFTAIVMRILSKAEHWVENGVEESVLMQLGIYPHVCPSYLGNKDIEVSYFWRDNPQVYVSCGKGRQKEYGFDTIERIADKVPHVTFHLYGDEWITKHKNVIVHGRVPKEEMNKQIKDMQCGLRLNEFDGFSEITAKSILMGQYSISRIHYHYSFSFDSDEELIACCNHLRSCYTPNLQGRAYYQKILNNYPWVSKTR